MFRYFAFSWNVAAATQGAAAQRLEDTIRCAEGWHCAHAGPGLRVFTIGSRAGVNESYPLPRSSGVVLGHLFRRRDSWTPSRQVDLSASEGEWILQTEGRALVDDYWGRYVAVFRPRGTGAFVLRDPSATLPCFQKEIEGVAVLFSWLEDLIAFASHSLALRVNWAAIAAFIALRSLGGRETALEGLSHVLPGRLTPLGETDTSPITFWSATTIAGNPVEPEPCVAAAQLRQEAIDCVHAWASLYDAMVLRLSGGVDSAILLGSLPSRPTTSPITCLNYYSSGPDGDERGYARLAAARAGLELIERERDVGVRLEDVVAVSRMPVPEIYVGRMGADVIDAEVASAHRARAMFTGGGGDQLFFQLRCSWPAADYLSRHGPDRHFIRVAVEAARLGNVSLWQSMWRAFADQRHRHDPVNDLGGTLTLAHRDAIAAVQIERYMHPELSGDCGLPIGKFQHMQMLLHPAGYYDPYMREAAPEMVNPLVSQPLVELCLRLPTWLLTHGGKGRGLARRAFAADIPREIATRQSKGGMGSYVTTVFRRNQSFARDLLLDGLLVRHGLLDKQRLEVVLAGRLSSLGGNVGEIHHCIAIEAWLRQFINVPIR
jgi:asparagine synthase (glutamine-hydrolysing)